MPLSRGPPKRLKKPLKNRVLVTFSIGAESTWVEVRGFPVARVDARPCGLRHGFCPLLRGSVSLLGKPRQKWEQQGFGIVHRPCGI